jgi:hypothetical protein
VANDEHNENEKLHNTKEKLRNSVSEESQRKKADEADANSWSDEEKKVDSASQPENESVRLADLPIDDKAFFLDYVAESEARWARLRPDTDELPPDPVSDYNIAIADHTQEIAKTAMNREPIALTPQPITIIPAPAPSSAQTQHGTVASNSDVYSNPSNTREFRFTREDLDDYVAYRSARLAPKSKDWLNRASKVLWNCTEGEISRTTVTTLREVTLEKYKSADSHSKVLSFASAFLKHLATTRGEPRYQAFAPYLELPKTVKERKSVTSRIVTTDDISNVLQHIAKAEREGQISPERSAQYSALVLFGAYTGQRSEATIAKLTVGQFRTGLAADKPVLQVESSQDKVRMSHYAPLHPSVVEALKPLQVGRNDDDLMFTHSSFLQWMKRQKIPMSRFKGHFQLGDLRKFAEQHGDVIQWDQSNRAYILTHGVSGVDWAHYKHPLPEDVYRIYMKAWHKVDLAA